MSKEKKVKKSSGKTLLLVRHAKSDWNDSSLSDFERPLNDRGKADAPLMAKRLVELKIPIELFISSPAKRAKKTAKIFAKTYGRDKDELVLRDELYGAGAPVFFDTISHTANQYDHIAVFSHNPGITDFANQLTDARIDNIPTCGVFAIKINTDSWSDFRNAPKEFWFFDFPKQSPVIPG
jgi:phosphohistidine phosphatase